jgi:hypothetical protein
MECKLPSLKDISVIKEDFITAIIATSCEEKSEIKNYPDKITDHS